MSAAASIGLRTRGRQLRCTARANDEDDGTGVVEAAVFSAALDDGAGALTGRWSRSEDENGGKPYYNREKNGRFGIFLYFSN